ncbi:amidohydrolase family protein [Micromonospora robiginosa]|uniref:Amidohydrolase family protein n=1 Tax=Micromonospora robiginosa TaxID=2749844 RepID=A0A7L6B3T6_9ACTN|nr:amidohydrolase family protein [Micromonospora ferruginea]QLQ36579.1 amidohydrolase family protein [Micromonospora ferruginea]
MKNDFFIFDNAIHMYKLTEDNYDETYGGGRKSTNALVEYAKKYSRSGFPYDDISDRELSVEDAYRLMFEESDTDIAMAQTVPSHGGWKLGFSPAENNYKLKEAYPDRVLFCGGVDPITHGRYGAVTEAIRQIEEWGAVSFKFYQAHSGGVSWRIDDPDVAYPIWEACLEHGVTNVQFHKGLAFNTQHIIDLAPYDLERAAQDFPEMNFIVHHLGEPFIDETINIASRYENIHLALTAWINQYPVAPRAALHAIGKCLLHVGPDRLLWGSEAFVWPKVQAYIDLFAEMTMPEDLQDGYGYPELTDEVKAKIFGLNYAAMMGIDVAAKTDELYGPSPSPVPAPARKAVRRGRR